MKKLKKAVMDGDINRIRAILIEMVTSRGANSASIEEVTAVVAGTEGLFEPDDGKKYAQKSEHLTTSMLEALKEDIRGNFSLPKFQMLAEAHQMLRSDPDCFESREAQLRETIAEGAAAAEVSRETDEQAEYNRRNPGRVAGRKFGYVVLLLGLAAAIVGVSVPVKFLIGLGIGVLMLGSAIVYSALPRR